MNRMKEVGRCECVCRRDVPRKGATLGPRNRCEPVGAQCVPLDQTRRLFQSRDTSAGEGPMNNVVEHTVS